MKQRISKFTLAVLLTIAGCTTAWAGQETQNGKTYNVVYLSSKGTGTGDSSDSPVNTWANAYKKLTNTGNRDYDWEHNIIVIVGEMTINYKENATKDKSNNQGTAATITGVWPWNANDKATTDQIKNGGKAKIAGIDNNIGADVRFRNLLIQGDGGLQDRMSLRLHSTCFDEGLVMMGFAELGTAYGMIGGRKAPALHLQLSFDQIKGGDPRPADVVYKMPNDLPMTVTFKSGKYGRVAVSRTQGDLVTTNYVQGTPNNPVMANIIMDIQDGNDNTGGYADDISILLGGSSQGFVCADLQFDIKHGTIGTLVAGTQGNNISSARNKTIPDATFAGRTKVNVGNENGADNDVTIQTYFGGTQGRAQTSQVNTAPSFFYGESEYNMYSGTVVKGVYASATAFSGLGDETNHTPDYAIPYVNGSNVLTFGSYSSSGKMATVKSTFHKGEDGYIEGQDYIDLSTTKLTFNIYGGHIYEGLYGGSKGYEPQIDATKAVEGAGTHYGDTYVNVYGGTIEGGIYGGGLGTKEYFDKVYETDKSTKKFLTVAQVFGNTHVNIYGGNIQGNIYGGGYGIATDKNEYLDIAKVIGSTNVTINPTDPSWTFTGNIYGGGALGSVEGNTNVTILGGIINGNVFGAGQGEEGHPNKAKVTGTTNVTVGE